MFYLCFCSGLEVREGATVDAQPGLALWPEVLDCEAVQIGALDGQGQALALHRGVLVNELLPCHIRLQDRIVLIGLGIGKEDVKEGGAGIQNLFLGCPALVAIESAEKTVDLALQVVGLSEFGLAVDPPTFSDVPRHIGQGRGGPVVRSSVTPEDEGVLGRKKFQVLKNEGHCPLDGIRSPPAVLLRDPGQPDQGMADMLIPDDGTVARNLQSCLSSPLVCHSLRAHWQVPVLLKSFFRKLSAILRNFKLRDET